jgi:hypothetical protein
MADTDGVSIPVPADAMPFAMRILKGCRNSSCKGCNNSSYSPVGKCFQDWDRAVGKRLLFERFWTVFCSNDVGREVFCRMHTFKSKASAWKKWRVHFASSASVREASQELATWMSQAEGVRANRDRDAQAYGREVPGPFG